MKILVPTLLFLLVSACASKPKMTYCDLVTEEPTESYSSKARKQKRSSASEAKSSERRKNR